MEIFKVLFLCHRSVFVKLEYKFYICYDAWTIVNIVWVFKNLAVLNYMPFYYHSCQKEIRFKLYSKFFRRILRYKLSIMMKTNKNDL